MLIDLNMAINQARQIQTRSNNLRDARVKLLSFQRELQSNWRGAEMAGLNNAINSILNRMVSSSSDLDAIAAEIKTAAQEVRRQEELAELAAAEQEVT